MKKIKKLLREYGPALHDTLSALKWRARWRVPFLHPQILRAVRKLSYEKIAGCKPGGKAVLFFGVRQDRIHTAWEFVMAQALRLRGHKVDFIACDGALRRCCNERWYPELKKSVCRACFEYAQKFYERAGFPVDWVSRYCEPSDLAEGDRRLESVPFEKYREMVYKGLPVGQLVRPSVCHFTRTENIEAHGRNDAAIRRIYKDFLHGSIMMVNACGRILDKYSPDKIVIFNGLFMSERIMLELSKQRKIRAKIIESGLRPDTVIMIDNHYISYAKTDGWGDRASTLLTTEQEEVLDHYLEIRKAGGGQTMEYWTDSLNDKDSIKERLGLSGFDKIAVLFPNVTWDSALYGLDIMFATLQEWIEKTVIYFKEHPRECLIIRTHPADKTWQGGMRDSIYGWITEFYGEKLPPNVKVIAPDDPISSYVLMELADCGLVFSSTTGLEMALIGKPVVVVGKVHFWNRGFTMDPLTEAEYYGMLGRILGPSGAGKGDTNLQLARRYAYYIFYEASINIKFVNSNNYRLSPPELTLDTYNDLLPGKDRALDVICDGIAHDKPFVL